MSALATLARLLGVRPELAEDALHSERAARAALTRRNLIAAAGAMASGAAFGFMPLAQEPIIYTFSNCEVSIAGRRYRSVGLDFPDEASKAWAEEHREALQGWVDRFWSAYSARPVLLDGPPSVNPHAICVGRLLSLAANGLRAAFPDTPLIIEELTS